MTRLTGIASERVGEVFGVKFARMRFPSDIRCARRSASKISLRSEGRICTAAVETIGRRGAGGPYRSRFPLIDSLPPSSCSLLFLVTFMRSCERPPLFADRGAETAIAVLLLFLLVVRRKRRPGYVTLRCFLKACLPPSRARARRGIDSFRNGVDPFCRDRFDSLCQSEIETRDTVARLRPRQGQGEVAIIQGGATERYSVKSAIVRIVFSEQTREPKDF